MATLGVGTRHFCRIKPIKSGHVTVLYTRYSCAFISEDIRYRLRTMHIHKIQNWIKDTLPHMPDIRSHSKMLPTVALKLRSLYSKKKSSRLIPQWVVSVSSNVHKDSDVKDNVSEAVHSKSSIEDMQCNGLDDLMKKSVVIEEGAISKLDTEPDESDISDKERPIDDNSEDGTINKSNSALNYSDRIDKKSDAIKTESSTGKKDDDSFMQTLAKIYQIPVGSLLKYREALADIVEDKKPVVRSDFISRSELMRRTRELVESMKVASTLISQETRTYELCKHLIEYPDCRAMAIKEGVLPLLLDFRDSKDPILQAQARQGLAVVGYVNPPMGRGVRVLTIDGGGTKGLVTLEALKHIQQSCDMDIDQLFDYVCGVSTGALIAAMVFMYHVPLPECERIYKDFSSRMFTQNRIVGTGQLMWSHAFYDTVVWQELLRQYMGERLMIESAKDPLCPKISAVSCVTNIPRLTNFIFRNYNLPSEALAQYPGNCKNKVWEVIRASSAAPGYYEEFQLGDFVHQDGGLFTNNPAALAIHECRLLWPEESLQCVVSLGNGQYEPILEVINPSRSSLKVKLTKVIDSATDTEAVHTTLQDLLPPSTYFRFNPYLSEEILLDEIRPEKWDLIQKDAEMYFRKNEAKLTRCTGQLSLKRRLAQSAADYLKEKIVQRT